MLLERKHVSDFEQVLKEIDFGVFSLQVFDKDMVGSDDFMGEATIDLTELNLLK